MTDGNRNGKSCVGGGGSLRTNPSRSAFHQRSSVDFSILACSLTSMPSNLYAKVSLTLNTKLSDTLAQTFALASIAHVQDHVDANGSSAWRSGAVRSWSSSEIDRHSRLALERSRRKLLRNRCTATTRGVITICGSVDVECQCTALCLGRVLFGLKFFSIELSWAGWLHNHTQDHRR